jgi:hypothetical protein
MSPEPTEETPSEASQLSPNEQAQSVPFIRRIFGRNLMDMSVLLLITVVFSGLRQPGHVLSEADLWWHLADARFLWTTHHFIHADAYSFTVSGQRWVNPEWLSELPYWFGYWSLGFKGIYLATWLGIGANVLFLYWRSYFKCRHAGVALWTAALGFVLMTVNANARTILYAYLALSAEMAILELAERGRPRALWILPPLFCVWINLHGSWIIGIALLALYILSGLIRLNIGIFQQEPFTRTQRKRLIVVLAASIAMLIVNPYGWRLVWNPFDMAFNQTLNIANVQEWQPLNLGWFVGKAALAAIALLVIANAINSRKWRIYELAVVFFAWYSAFDHARFTFLAAVLTIPMLAEDLKRSFFPVVCEKTIPVMNGLMAVGAACVIAWYIPSQAKLENAMAGEWPLQIIGSIQPSWRTLNQENLGGLMAFYSKPTFVDTRWDIFEHHGIMKDFIDIVHSQDSLSLLDKYHIDHVLFRQDEQLTYLLAHTPGWKVVRNEGDGHAGYTLFARSTAAAAACASPGQNRQAR